MKTTTAQINDIKSAVAADPKLATALAIISGNCGEDARNLILSGRSCLRSKDIGTISRMAPERQRYEMEQVAQGRPPFQKPKEGIPPLDTVNFKEVKSRLGRALGLITKNVRDIPRLPAGMRPTDEEKGYIREKLTAIVADSLQLLTLLEDYKDEE